MNALNRLADPVYCIMRFIVGLMFACHGLDHVFGKFGGHAASAGSLFFIGGWSELVCGLLIAFGLITRIAAIVSSGQMAVAYFMMHASGKAIGHPATPTEQFFPILNKGDLAVVLCWLFLFMFFYGAGRWSLDNLFWRERALPGTMARA